MEDRDRILDYAKPVRPPDDCSKARKNFTQGYFYREIGCYKNAVPSEFQWAAEDKLINKSAYEELKCQLPDSPRSTFLMVFSPDGKKVASTHGNHNVYVTDLTTGKNIQTLSGHPRTPWCIAFHPSSNQILASGCLGGQVRVWDLHGGSEVWTAESQTVIASLAFHPVDRMLVIATYNELHFWDWSQPEPFAKCSTKSEREKVRYVSFDRLGNKLITGIANPVNVPSQWDRVNVVNSQPPVTPTTASLNSTTPTTVATTQSPSDQGRSITFCYHRLMNQYNQLVNRYFDLSRSRITPTIDRGTDPMDLIDLLNNGNNSESSSNNPSPSTSNSQTNPSSPLRFKFTRSACRSYRPLGSRERFRIHSSVFSRLSNRSSVSSTSVSTTATSTPVSRNSTFTSPPSVAPVVTPSSPPAPRIECAFSLVRHYDPTARSWCLTLGAENSSNSSSARNTSQSATSSGAITNPTYTSYPDRGIFCTREASSNSSERSHNSVIRPYRLLFDDDLPIIAQRTTQSDNEEGTSNRIQVESRPNLSFNAEQAERVRSPRRDSIRSLPERLRPPNRDSIMHSPSDIEIERELRRPSLGLYSRRQDIPYVNSTQFASSLSSESSTRNIRSSSRFHLTPAELRVSPVRRWEDGGSGEVTGNSRSESQSLSQSLMHPRPVPRFQVRSRALQDQQSQLHLITNRETHELNLQNNQSLRRHLSFRPGGQFVLSRHSNSPFQPRVPSYNPNSMNSSTAMKNNSKSLKPEIPSHRSSFTTSASSSTNLSESPSTSSSVGNVFTSSSVASNLSFTGEGTSRQLPEQINRRLFDRVKMMLRDRIQNSSESASTDSTVNYSRISGESEVDMRSLRDISLELEENNTARGLGPRGADPMLSSASENLDTSNDTVLLPNSGNSSPIPGTANGAPSSINGLNTSQSELLDPWESETDTVPFSLSSPLSGNEVLSEQPQFAQESTSQEVSDNPGPSQASTSTNSAENSGSSLPEFSMGQGIKLLSLHIENMQRLCWARIEILQLQKIRGMWEDLTNQIRHFHNTIQNRRTAGDGSSTSGQNDNSNSSANIPSIRNLAISSSPVPEYNSSSTTPSESTNEANVINDYKELVETMLNELFNESKNNKTTNNESRTPADQAAKISPKGKTKCEGSAENKSSISGSSNLSSRNETEEPQPGPSGLSTPSTSQGVRNSLFRNGNFKFGVYKLLRDSIQRTRRRREVKSESGTSNSSGFQRQNSNFRIRNSSRTRFRSHRHSRCLFDSSISRSRARKRELDAILQLWKNEKCSNKSNPTNQPVPSTSQIDSNQPSTSAYQSSSSSDACQSCGQKKKPVRESCTQKKRTVDSFSDLGSSGSASKVLKNSVGERSEAPNREESGNGEFPVDQDGASSSRAQENSTNDLLKQMIQTMERMLRFQREAFRRTEELTGGRSARQQPLTLPSSGEDSDSDQNNSTDQSELFTRNQPRNFRSNEEVNVNLMRDITQLHAKRLLGFMVRSLTQSFGKNFSKLNKVLDGQIFSLYMLLYLALELTDLLLDQLNARSRDLERTWAVDNPDVNNSESRGRNWILSRPSSVSRRMRERSRNFCRSSFNPPYGASREESLRYRVSNNPFLRSHSRLISSRPSSSGSPNTITIPNTSFKSYYRRKRQAPRMPASMPCGWYSRNSRISSQPNSSRSSTTTPSRIINGNSIGGRYRSFRLDRNTNGEEQSYAGIRAFDYEINNNSSTNDTNNNYSLNDDRNNNNNNNNNNVNNNNDTNRNTGSASNSSDISSNSNNINDNFLNYYFSNNNSRSNSDNSANSNSNGNIIIVTGVNRSNDIINSTSNSTNSGVRNNSNEGNISRQSGSSASFLNQPPLPPLRSMELTLSRNDSGDLSLRDERPIFWIRYGGNNETSGTSSSNDSQSRVSTFTVPVVQVNDVPVSDVSMLNQPRHRPQSPVPRVPEDIWRWRAWRPRFLHPRYSGPNPFDDQDSNDVSENIHYYRILSTSAGSHLGVYTLDPMIITDAPLSPHHRIQAWDFSKMNIPDISDREANGVVSECKIHNDASVDVSNDGHLLVTLLPSGRLSVTTMLGVYSLDWSSLGQLLYRTSFEQNAVSVSLSPTNRHLLVGLASRPIVVRDRTNMAQIFRLEGGRPSPHGGSWQSGRGRLVHMRDLEHTREANMSLNCIRWAPGAGQGLVYGTNTGQLKVLR